MFAGRATPDEVLEHVRNEGVTRQRESALFYAHFYIGLYHEVTGASEQARRHIELAATTHTSPYYMGDIARMHAGFLKAGNPQTPEKRKSGKAETGG